MPIVLLNALARLREIPEDILYNDLVEKVEECNFFGINSILDTIIMLRNVWKNPKDLTDTQTTTVCNAITELIRYHIHCETMSNKDLLLKMCLLTIDLANVFENKVMKGECGHLKLLEQLKTITIKRIKEADNEKY